MKTIITYGTFDLFHVGHVRLLKRLKEMCEKLVVGVSTDSFNNLKGKSTIMSFDDRSEIVYACRYVDKVFAETCWEQKREDIIREKAEIFAMGDDWQGKFDELNSICKVIYLPRTDNISTTQIKENAFNYLNREKLEVDNFR